MNFVPGLIIPEKEREEDYIFLGGNLDRVRILPGGDWRPYLPTEEAQATRKFDPFSCVSMSFNNVIETHLMKMMESDPDIKLILEQLNALDDNGRPNFSDRWLAKMSGTVPGRGNTMDNIFDTVRKCGLVGEKVWPKTDDMGEVEYYKEIPQDIKDKGLEFLKYFDFGYESLPYANFMVKYPTDATLNEALEYSPLWVCVDGRYEYDENGLIGEQGKAIAYNHATTNVAIGHWVFDSYDPFLKQFVDDYKFGYAKSIHIKKKVPMLYKVKGQPAIYAASEEEKVMIPFADGAISGGKLFKALYGVDDYKTLPRIDVDSVDKLPYPIATYSFKTM